MMIPNAAFSVAIMNKNITPSLISLFLAKFYLIIFGIFAFPENFCQFFKKICNFFKGTQHELNQ